MMWVGTEGKRVICNQHVPTADTTDGYFDAFEKYIRMVSNFHVSRHRFYQLKQDKDDPVDIFILWCRHTLEECFPMEQRNPVLLDHVIFGGKHGECERKMLSKGGDLALDRTLEFICTKEVTDASYNEIFWKDNKLVDAVWKKVQ